MTTENFDKARVMERVRKMLALANDAAATEGERDNAMRMAHATLAKYNLTIGEAERAGAKPEGRMQGELKMRNRPWRRLIAQAVAGLYFCEVCYMQTGRNNAVMYFVGREANVLTATEMSAYIIESVNKEGRAYSNENSDGENSAYYRFCKGAAHRIWQRCTQLRAEAERASQQEAASVPGTSLVLASHYAAEKEANSRWMVEHHPSIKTGKWRERGTTHDAAYTAGSHYGSTVGLNKQVRG